MKLKNKLIFGIASLSAIVLPVTLLASCSKTPESNNNPNDKPITPPDEKPTEPVEPPVVLKPTTSKNEINKSVLGLEQTVEKNAFKINNQWIFNNKTKLLDGDTSLFTSVEDIIQFSAQPSANDETKLDINFTLKAGKARAENNEPTTEDTSFKVIVSSFDAPTRTLETLSELLNNFLSSKVQPKKFIMPEDKFIRINERPGEGTGTTKPTTTWLTAQNPNNSRGISLGSSTGPNCIWVPYGWNKSQSNNEQSDVWNWLENNGISNGDLHSYINNLLKDYKYINTSDEVTTIYLYSQLREYKQDEKTSGGIWVYRKKYAPIGWGFKINNSGRDDVIINDGIRVPGDGNYIENSFKSNEINFDFGYKWESGGTTGAEETIDFTPNYIVNETVINGFKVNSDGTILKYLGDSNNIVIPESFQIQGKQVLVKKIGNSAFKDNDKINSVTLPANLQIIDTEAFAGSSIKKVIFPENSSLTSINDRAFFNTQLNGEITFPINLTTIGNSSFESTKLSSVNFKTNAKISSLGSYSFKKIPSLTTFDLSNCETSSLTLNQEVFHSSPLTQFILPSIKGKIGELTLHTLAFYENQLPELDFRSIGSLVLNGQSIFKAESDQTNILNVYFPEQIRTPNSEWYWFLIRGGKKVNAYTPNNVSKSQLINMLALNDSEFNKYFEHLTY